MIVTVEISMYPFRNDFRDIVKDFIDYLSSYDKLEIVKGSTSTVLIGDYAYVMDSLKELFLWSHNKHGQAVFAVKFALNYCSQYGTDLQ
jgi:uncharacterized protein YqgV (UPF0045/DUF77 family)